MPAQRGQIKPQRGGAGGVPPTVLPDTPQQGAALLAALQALPAELPVVALLYEGGELIDARWTTRAAVTATLAASQPVEATA
jgi:hypothetical protein